MNRVPELPLKAARRFDRRSLRWKLPWLFAVTAVLTVAAFGIFAYGSARKLAIETASTRLRSALSQLKTVVELGVVNQVAFLRLVAHDPAIIASLQGEGQVSDSAVRALRLLKGVSDSSVLVELIDRRGTVRHVLPEAAGTRGQHRSLIVPRVATIGPMQQHDSVVSFAATIAVSSGQDSIGWIRVVRPQRNAVNRRMAGNLLDGAVVLSGNSDGTVWTPSGQVRYPVLPEAGTQRYLRHGERWLSASSGIRGTPWLYVVEIPERVALAPANALVMPFLLTGLLIAFAGAFVGVRISRRITAPLGDLTMAAEAYARGERYVKLSATDRQDEIGRLARAFGTMTDCVTTDRDRLEAEVMARTGELSTASGRLHALHEELRESERLATLGRLSGSVGHELRNPLGVMSNIAFLLDSLPDASEKLKQYAGMLREQVRVSDRIISDLLDRARSGASVRTAVDIAQLLDDMVLRANVPSSIRVERQVATSLPVLVLDRDHVMQIVWNLVTNAVQAMQGREGVLTISAVYADRILRIEVQDSGDGIPDTDIDRVFEPLFTTKPSGIGLGLSVSRAFARANGGDLFVRKTAVGACFVLELPAMPAANGPGVESPFSNRDRGGFPEASRVRRDSPPRLEKV
jgi:signal transduction histidine kinase